MNPMHPPPPRSPLDVPAAWVVSAACEHTATVYSMASRATNFSQLVILANPSVLHTLQARLSEPMRLHPLTRDVTVVRAVGAPVLLLGWPENAQSS